MAIYRPILRGSKLFCLIVTIFGTHDIVVAVALELRYYYTSAFFFYAWPSTLLIAHKNKKSM